MPRASRLAFRLGLARNGLARRFRHSNPTRFRRFRPPVLQPLREPRQLLLNSSYLRLVLLPPLRKGSDLLPGGRELGLELGEISPRFLLLVSLGQKLILGRLRLGQLRAEIALGARRRSCREREC